MLSPHQGLQQQTQQTQQMVASSVQVLLSSLVEMPLADLEERLQNELMDNEALEVSENEEGSWDNEHREEAHENTEAIDDAMSDYRTLDDVPETLREAYNQRGEENERQRQLGEDENGYDELYRQIGECDLNEEEARVMTYLVGSLDERGYLTKDDATLSDELAFSEYLDVSPQEVARLVQRLQSFEPRGIGARDLRECLLLQLPRTGWTRQVVDECFDLLTQARWERIQERLDVDDETIAQVRHEITHLNPRPGALLSESSRMAAPSIVPDFRIEVDAEGQLLVQQLRGNIPTLQVSPAFAETLVMHHQARDKATAAGQKTNLSREQEEAYVYARQKVEAAHIFIESLRRRHETLQRVVESIVQLQSEFFLNDDDELLLRPMVLKDVATLAGVDVSTVSRAVNSKYVQTLFGTYSLKFFFSTQFANSDGDTVAARQVKAALLELVEQEDKRAPHSDEQLARLLAERGLKVARRTVTKYREQLGIAKASLRHA